MYQPHFYARGFEAVDSIKKIFWALICPDRNGEIMVSMIGGDIGGSNVETGRTERLLVFKQTGKSHALYLP